MDRWVPEQVIQTKIPKFQEAQRGSISKMLIKKYKIFYR